MAFKTLIFFGLLAVALGFAIPEEQFDEPQFAYGEQTLADDNIALVRNARSPQGRLEARGEHSNRGGSSATVDYVHPINKNLEGYVGASRNFKYNDNSGHAGLRLRF